MSNNIFKFLFTGIILTFSACRSGQESPVTNTQSSNFHKIVVEEVLQATEYTYLRVSENSKNIWVAVPTMAAKTGDTYYYEGGIEMKKFESKELNKVFESIILLEKLNTEPKSSPVTATDKPYPSTAVDNPSLIAHDGAAGENYKRKATPPEKKEVAVTVAKGGISISELYAKKDNYSGKTVKIKGQVTKYTPAVMNKNWIHIQDGTDDNGKFDLAITSESEVKVGDIVTFEGKVALNKDLGYGYFFEVIMEDAVLK